MAYIDKGGGEGMAMKLKLAVLTLYALAVGAPVALLAGPAVSQQAQDKIIVLDQHGERGEVRFNHTKHEPFINPDPDFPYKGEENAACSGCHHTTSQRGIPQLWKCYACHKGEGYKGEFKGVPGQTENPKNRNFDEVFAERAFHDLCIGCHRATNEKENINRAPVTCSGCHKAPSPATGR